MRSKQAKGKPGLLRAFSDEAVSELLDSMFKDGRHIVRLDAAALKDDLNGMVRSISDQRQRLAARPQLNTTIRELEATRHALERAV
jgi:hypothetical protein